MIYTSYLAGAESVGSPLVGWAGMQVPEPGRGPAKTVNIGWAAWARAFRAGLTPNHDPHCLQINLSLTTVVATLPPQNLKLNPTPITPTSPTTNSSQHQ